MWFFMNDFHYLYCEPPWNSELVIHLSMQYIPAAITFIPPRPWQNDEKFALRLQRCGLGDLQQVLEGDFVQWR